MRDLCKRLVTDGFEVIGITGQGHLKIFLKRDGRRFFIAVAGTPSDRRRWIANCIQNARQAFREHQGKPA